MRAFGMALAICLGLAASSCGPKAEGGVSASGAPSADTAASQAALDPCRGLLKSVCADKDIAALGTKVDAALAHAASSVSAQGLNILAANEKGWIEATRLQCGVPEGAASLSVQQGACLKSALASRARDALNAVEKKGPFTFQRVEINQTDNVAPSAAARLMGPDAPKTLSHAIQFPRIDGDSAIAQKFNAAVAQAPRFKPADQTEERTTYQIGYSGPDLISVRFDRQDLSVGAARPNASATAVTFNMRTGARLAAADVFKPGVKWQDFLAGRAAADLTKQIQNEDETARPIDPADIRDAVAKAQSWYVTDKALVLLLPSGALAPSSLDSFEVSIPWQDLKPYLNPQGPGPIKSA